MARSRGPSEEFWSDVDLPEEDDEDGLRDQRLWEEARRRTGNRGLRGRQDEGQLAGTERRNLTSLDLDLGLEG